MMRKRVVHTVYSILLTQSASTSISTNVLAKSSQQNRIFRKCLLTVSIVTHGISAHSLLCASEGRLGCSQECEKSNSRIELLACTGYLKKTKCVSTFVPEVACSEFVAVVSAVR